MQQIRHHDEIRRYTFQEVRTASSALAKGPSAEGWGEVEGESALRHADGGLIEVKFESVGLVTWLGLTDSKQVLWEHLRGLGLPAVLLYHVCLARLLDRRGLCCFSLDELINQIGWLPRSTMERLAMRRRIWLWLATFDGWTIVGRRKGTYRDPVTRQIPDLWVDSALFKIVERGFVDPSQLALDGSTPPLEVTLSPGPWLTEFLGNERVLSYFGTINRIAAIPAGKPGGAWAHAVGLSLQQRWRERAARAAVRRVGEDKHLTVDFGRFTRRDLLGLFPPDPTVFVVLQSAHPGRAKTYWRDAIGALTAQGVIGHYSEAPIKHVGRKHWDQDWLDQPLDIRPDREGREAIAEIVVHAHRARRSRSRNEAGK